MSRWTVPYHHGSLPEALMDGVAKAVSEHGVSGVSLRDVARQAGVSHSAPAHHFGSKAGMLTAFAARGYDLLAESVIAEVVGAEAADGAAELEAIGRGYVAFAIGHPAEFEVMFSPEAIEIDDPRLHAASENAYALLTSTIMRCANEGRLHGRSPEVVAVAAWSMVHGLSTLWLSGRLAERIKEQDPHRLAAEVSALFVEAILPA
jgi:AcrR family transcriptional regulator